MTLCTVRRRVLQASLWNTIMTEVLGRSAESAYLTMHLKHAKTQLDPIAQRRKEEKMNDHERTRGSNNNKRRRSIYLFFLTSGRVRFRGILSLASKLYRFIWNNCCISWNSRAGIRTGSPLFPSQGLGSNMFLLIISGKRGKIALKMHSTNADVQASTAVLKV